MALAELGQHSWEYTRIAGKFQVVYPLRGHSSAVEHSTADREVTGSNPVAPSLYFILFYAGLFTHLHRFSIICFVFARKLSERSGYHRISLKNVLVLCGFVFLLPASERFLFTTKKKEP